LLPDQHIFEVVQEAVANNNNEAIQSEAPLTAKGM